MSHFAAIGLTGETEEEVQAAVIRALELGAPPPEMAERQDRHLWFRDASGAAVAAHLTRKGEVDCATPFFADEDGGTRWRVRTSAPHLDRECAHCSGADCDVLDRASGELVTRATVQWLFFEPYRSWLEGERDYDLEVVGFASGLWLGETSDDLERAQAQLFGERDPSAPLQQGKPLRLADEAFLPYGMFENAGDVTQRARGFVTGAVSKLSTPVNALTGRRFVQLRVRTLCGDLNVVAPELALSGAPSAPRLALADVWLVGRPTEPPPPPKRGWLKLVRG